uniref:Rh161.2 n=1 Tax=Rhesus cytomegalovirus (strain 68-1) TaxID=47929 RepID=F8V7H6_RHCM6|nr:rh161.2 [macacine betaherpesvirus 3]
MSDHPESLSSTSSINITAAAARTSVYLTFIYLIAMRSLVLHVVIMFLCGTVQGTAREKECPCKGKTKLGFIPPKSDCLWLHQYGSPCGNEAIAHFPQTVMNKNGKPQLPLCLDFQIVNSTIPNGNGIYCVKKTVNETREYVRNCNQCNKFDLHLRMDKIWHANSLWWLDWK